jgi:uncharacterized OsmC-like protein
MQQTITRQEINGIDTAALKAAMEVISDRPAEGKARFEVATRWTGGTRSETRVSAWELGGARKERNFAIFSDEPPELCGTATAPNPQEILMAGLNACMMVGYVAVCALKGIELEALSIETDGELDLRGFLGLDPAIKPGYEEVRYRVRIRGNATAEQFQEVHETVMATSPNFWNVSQPVRLAPELVVEQA